MMETLADTARIIKSLERLLEQRILITAWINGHAQGYTTTITDVSIQDEEYMILNELRPMDGNELIKATPTIKLTTQLDGVAIDFSANVNECHRKNGISYYKVTIPKSLNYYQRRASIRVPLSAAQSLPATLTTENNLTLQGDIADISIGGIRIRFTKNLPETLEPDQILKCSFPLPPDGKQNLTCQVLVRAVKEQHEGRKVAFIGGQFVSITTSQERQIERSVMLLQRIAQQKRNS